MAYLALFGFASGGAGISTLVDASLVRDGDTVAWLFLGGLVAALVGVVPTAEKRDAYMRSHMEWELFVTDVQEAVAESDLPRMRRLYGTAKATYERVYRSDRGLKE